MPGNNFCIDMLKKEWKQGYTHVDYTYLEDPLPYKIIYTNHYTIIVILVYMQTTANSLQPTFTNAHEDNLENWDDSRWATDCWAVDWVRKLCTCCSMGCCHDFSPVSLYALNPHTHICKHTETDISLSGWQSFLHLVSIICFGFGLLVVSV